MRYEQYILGSRSPRRRELLGLLVPASKILVQPPISSDEAGFEALTTETEIAVRLREIVQTKREDVDAHLPAADRDRSVMIVADTIIVAAEADGAPVVLEQPPESNWQSVVETWFSRYYSGRTHAVWTRVCVWSAAGILLDQTALTTITFRALTPGDIAWYLAREESIGKAGGYAVQGLASIFISGIHGSLSNVIGLPLELLKPILAADDA